MNISFDSSPYDMVITSDLKRCLQTANLLFPEHKLIPMQEFREMNFGPWEGKTYADLAGDPQFENWTGTIQILKYLGVRAFLILLTELKRLENSVRNNLIKGYGSNGDCYSWGCDSTFIINIWIR